MKLPQFAFLLLSTGALAGDFAGTAGLQLYSLRDQFKTDVPGTLDKVKAFGFKEVETASTYNVSPEQFASMLKERGLTAVSGHFPYDSLTKNVEMCVKDAKTLGLRYAACAWIPHDVGNFSEADVQRAAADFNRVGEAFKKEGITFAYHAHGYEFKPVSEGASETLFDRLAAATKPEFVAFEMDVFWVVHPGRDPVQLLEKYPGRWQLMHLKDIRKGARTGIYTGKAPLTDDVPLGTGQVDWPKVLIAASKSGVKHYFIEDESPTVLDAIPVTLKYLSTLK